MIEPNYKEMYKDWDYSALNRESIDLVIKMQQKYTRTYREQLANNSKHKALKDLLFEKKMRS